MISVLVKALTSFGIKFFMKVATEKLIEWAFFEIAEKIAKSTKTPHDDRWVSKIKELYYESDK